MVATVVGVALWVAVASLGGDDGTSPVLSRDRSPTPRAETVAPIAPPTEAPPPKKDKPPKPEETEASEEELVTEGITVQVLNASGTPGAEDPVAAELTELGFDIVATVEASKIYEQTTVFWSTDESRPAAEA